MINTIQRMIYFIIGVLLISYIIFLRFILVRLPRDLCLFPEFKYKLLITIVLGLLISIFIVYKSIKELFYVKSANTGFVTKLFIKLNLIISTALFEVYLTLGNTITDAYGKLSSSAQKFYDFFGYRNETILPSIIYLIRIIIVFCFLCDVFYFFRLNYFYKSLSLLIISLGIQLLIFVLKDFSNNLDDAKSFLNIKQTINQDNQPITTYVPSEGNEDIDLIYYVNQVILCQKLQGYFEIYDIVMLYYAPRANLFIYCCYLLGWIYVIYENILLFYAVI